MCSDATPCRDVMGVCLATAPAGTLLRRRLGVGHDDRDILLERDVVFQVSRCRAGYLKGQPIDASLIADVYAEASECRPLTDAEEAWVRQHYQPRMPHIPL